MNEITFGQSTMDAALHHANAFRTDLAEWLAIPVNFAVWSSFAYQANAAWNKGIRHYSAPGFVLIAAPRNTGARR